MTNSERKDLPPGAETDTRFPSGPWTGFYVQWGQRGQQDLRLVFKDGVIEGEGVDAAGPFQIEGQYDLQTGECGLTKHYAESHDVEYEGIADRTGISGNWLLYHHADPLGIPKDRGTFHIWPVDRAGGGSGEVEVRVPKSETAGCRC